MVLVVTQREMVHYPANESGSENKRRYCEQDLSGFGQTCLATRGKGPQGKGVGRWGWGWGEGRGGLILCLLLRSLLYLLGSTLLVEIVACVTVIFFFFFFLNPTIEVVTFRLCGWCTLSV